MHKVLLACCFFLNVTAISAIEKLPEKYRVSYGQKDATHKVTEYFSFMCPHCIALFRKDFHNVRRDFIENGKVYWEFHPIPKDICTVQAMVCLEKLNEAKKRIFLEAILELCDLQDFDINTALMQKAMEILDSPLPELANEDFLASTDAYMSSFNFLKQDASIDAIPSVEIDNKYYPTEIPDTKFLRDIIK